MAIVASIERPAARKTVPIKRVTTCARLRLAGSRPRRSRHGTRYPGSGRQGTNLRRPAPVIATARPTTIKPMAAATYASLWSCCWSLTMKARTATGRDHTRRPSDTRTFANVTRSNLSQWTRGVANPLMVEGLAGPRKRRFLERQTYKANDVPLAVLKPCCSSFSISDRSDAI